MPQALSPLLGHQEDWRYPSFHQKMYLDAPGKSRTATMLARLGISCLRHLRFTNPGPYRVAPLEHMRGLKHLSAIQFDPVQVPEVL